MLCFTPIATRSKIPPIGMRKLSLWIFKQISINFWNLSPVTSPPSSASSPLMILTVSSDGKSHPTSLAKVQRKRSTCLRTNLTLPCPFTPSRMRLITACALSSTSIYGLQWKQTYLLSLYGYNIQFSMVGCCLVVVFIIIGMKSNVMRIVVVGDPGVGKTSLVCAIISDLTSEVPKVHKKVVLPPDMCAYSKDIFTEIVDTGEGNDLPAEMRASDLILLVYDVSSEESIMRLREHWLPIISQACKQVPVVIVGNKRDRVQLPIDEQEEHTSVREVMKQLVRNYRQVQMGIECSAYYDRKVKQVLSSAQRAVLYPLAPLYDLSTKQITNKFRKALLRIFRILDANLTGSLSDADLIGLQERVFQTQLSPEDIRGIKNIIQKECHEQQGNSISEFGFVTFQKKCIEMLKIQICWSILRHFDYNNQLEIRAFEDSFVIDYAAGESLELSPHVLHFLHKAYVFAQKADPKNPMQRLFEPSPSIFLQEFREEGLELERYMLLWHMFTFLNYRECYRALLYIGYGRRLQDCFCISRGKKKLNDLLKLRQRRIYSILFVEDKEYAPIINPLFEHCIEQGVLIRNVRLYSCPTTSKVLLLFRIRQHHLRDFLAEDVAQRIDLIVHFGNAKRDLSGCPPHVMNKEITRQIAEKKLRLLDLPQMDLQSMPIKIKQYPFQRLIEYLLKIFSNIEQGYRPQYIQALKSQSQRLRNVLLGVATTAVVVFMGILTFTRKLK